MEADALLQPSGQALQVGDHFPSVSGIETAQTIPLGASTVFSAVSAAGRSGSMAHWHQDHDNDALQGFVIYVLMAIHPAVTCWPIILAATATCK